MIAMIVALAYTLKIDEAVRRVAARRGRGHDRKGAEQLGLAGNQSRLRLLGPDGVQVRRGPAGRAAGSRPSVRRLDHPGGFSKARQERKAPLAPRAVVVLDDLRRRSHGWGLIFRSANGKALSHASLGKLLLEQDI